MTIGCTGRTEGLQEAPCTALQVQQRPLDRQAATESDERAGGPDDPVAGHDDGDGVGAVGSADGADGPGISDAALLEIRRERGIDLALEGRRWDDLMRWKRGELLARPWRGMYVNANR